MSIALAATNEPIVGRSGCELRCSYIYIYMAVGRMESAGSPGVPGQISRRFRGVRGVPASLSQPSHQKTASFGATWWGVPPHVLNNLKLKKKERSYSHGHEGAAGRGMASRILRKPSPRASRILRTPHRGASRPTENNHRSHCINEFISGVGPCVLWSPGTLFCPTLLRPPNMPVAVQPHASSCGSPALTPQPRMPRGTPATCAPQTAAGASRPPARPPSSMQGNQIRSPLRTAVLQLGRRDLRPEEM